MCFELCPLVFQRKVYSVIARSLLVIIIYPTSVILVLSEDTGIMKKLNKKWTNIIRIYLGDSWVKNEQAVLNSLIKQQDSPPISLQQAREQIERLSQQSQSAVKRGHSSDYLASLMAEVHFNFTAAMSHG